MNSTHLNEHDANQGAQSSGEFLGMTGNSGWYLLGAGGATILMVIFLWGILGVSLLLCLFVGILLCLAAVAYVFALKNGKPEHYDSDFFESALVEAGLLQFSFGPRIRRPVNPFIETGAGSVSEVPVEKRRSARPAVSSSRSRAGAVRLKAAAPDPVPLNEDGKNSNAKREPVVTLRDYENLQEKLTTTEELLEEAMAGAED